MPWVPAFQLTRFGAWPSLTRQPLLLLPGPSPSTSVFSFCWGPPAGSLLTGQAAKAPVSPSLLSGFTQVQGGLAGGGA